MESTETVNGNVWLNVELTTFLGTILISILFMFLRGCKELEVKIELIDKKKQLPSVDSVEALSVILS